MVLVLWLVVLIDSYLGLIMDPIYGFILLFDGLNDDKHVGQLLHELTEYNLYNFTFYFYFLHKLFYLVYSGIIVYFSQEGTSVPCHPFSVSASPLCCHIPDLILVVGGCGRMYLGEMRCLGEWVVCGSPEVPTWRGWALRHPPTGASVHWSGALAPGILVCRSG